MGSPRRAPLSQSSLYSNWPLGTMKIHEIKQHAFSQIDFDVLLRYFKSTFIYLTQKGSNSEQQHPTKNRDQPFSTYCIFSGPWRATTARSVIAPGANPAAWALRRIAGCAFPSRPSSVARQTSGCLWAGGEASKNQGKSRKNGWTWMNMMISSTKIRVYITVCLIYDCVGHHILVLSLDLLKISFGNFKSLLWIWQSGLIISMIFHSNLLNYRAWRCITVGFKPQ